MCCGCWQYSIDSYCRYNANTMSVQKRKVTTPKPTTSPDTTGEDPPRIRNITACVTIKKQMKYDVIYTVAFTKACCEFHKKNSRWFQIKADVGFFNDGANTAALMMNKTINAIKNHKKQFYCGGINACNLDWTGGRHRGNIYETQ